MSLLCDCTLITSNLDFSFRDKYVAVWDGNMCGVVTRNFELEPFLHDNFTIVGTMCSPSSGGYRNSLEQRPSTLCNQVGCLLSFAQPFQVSVESHILSPCLLELIKYE